MNRPIFNSKTASFPEDEYGEYSALTPEQLGDSGFSSYEPEPVARQRKEKEKKKTKKQEEFGDLTYHTPGTVEDKKSIRVPKGQKVKFVENSPESRKLQETAVVPSDHLSNRNYIKAAMKIPVLTAISAFPCPTCKGKMHGGFPEAPADRSHDQIECITCGNLGYHEPREHAGTFDRMTNVNEETRRHNDAVNWHNTHCLAGMCDTNCPVNKAVLNHKKDKKDKNGNIVEKACHPESECTDFNCRHEQTFDEGKDWHCQSGCDHHLGQGDFETGEGGPMGAADIERGKYVDSVRDNCDCTNGCEKCTDPKIPRHVAFAGSKSSPNTMAFAAYRAVVGEKDNIAPALEIMGGHPRQEIRRGTPIWHLGWDTNEPNAALHAEQPQDSAYETAPGEKAVPNTMYKAPQWGATVHVPGMPTPGDSKYKNGAHDEQFKQDYEDWTNQVEAANNIREQKNFTKSPNRQRLKRDESASSGGFQGKHVFGVVTNVSHDGQYVEGVHWGTTAKDERDALREQLKGQYGGRRKTMFSKGATVNSTFSSQRDKAVRGPLQNHISDALDSIQPIVGERSTARRTTAVPFACHISQVARMDRLNSQHVQVVGDVQTTMQKKDLLTSDSKNPDGTRNYVSNPESKVQVIVKHVKPTGLSTEGIKHHMLTTPNNEARRRLRSLGHEFEDTYGVPEHHPYNLIPPEIRSIPSGNVSEKDKQRFIIADAPYKKSVESPSFDAPMSAQMPGRLNRGAAPEISDRDVDGMVDTVNKQFFKKNGRNMSHEEQENVADGIHNEGHINGGMRAAGFDVEDEDEG